uniref:glycoside hydrolase family 3 N-terminal domain-containing protein n=1 Tax=uncultured Gemmiger sp. TaxID=1623490 RepID=UPI0025E9C979
MDTSNATKLKDALEADGFSVNPTMWDFYTTGAGSSYGLVTASGSLNNYIFNNAEFLVNEVPQSAYTDTEWNSVAQYGDAAVVVFGRICGEGADLPWYNSGDGDGNILSLTTEERDLLAKLAELKAAGQIKKIVVLLNATNPIELDFLNPAICGTDYSIDACLWVGEVGQTGINAIGDLLKGTVNPSGKLVDTYCYDNLTSPAIQNAHATSYTNAAEAGLAFAGSNNEYYVAYQEGIYVGYRYYETRYEDYVLGNANVGDYDYASTVAYPFGYGLSYTTFSYGPMTMQEEGDTFTFNVDVTNTGAVDGAEAVGRSMGNDCLLANGKAYSGIYGPGVNIHRTPYSGRNFEYYSEDPFISGKTCAAEVTGIQSKGVYVYMKHFALNDQETARDGICVWTNEQAAREIYLQAFEYPVEEANAYCVMTSFNRIGCVWAGGDYNLLTNILRGEWGMEGFAVTDFSNSNNYMDVVQGVLAGGDAWDCNEATKWTDKLRQYQDDATVVSAMRQATDRILYTVANSNAMNGVSPNMRVAEVITWWQIAFIACDVVFGLLAVLSIVMAVRSGKKAKAKAKAENA